VLGEYKGANTKILIKHSVDHCNYKYEVTPYNFIYRHNRCPKCDNAARSHGESSIREFLESNHCIYVTQYKFADCRNKKPLPFDFAVFNLDGSIKCLIEYQGNQHYQSIDYFGGKKTFKKRMKLDKIKSDFCDSRGLNLLKIHCPSTNTYKNVKTTVTDALLNFL